MYKAGSMRYPEVTLGFWWKVRGRLGLWGLMSLSSFWSFLPVLAFIRLYAVHLIFIGIYTMN